MECPKDCSECCENIILPLGYEADEDDICWIEYHDLKVIVKDGRQCVVINHPCSNLKNHLCTIYENRPDNCKLFLCEKLKSQLLARQTEVSSQKPSNA